MSDLSKLMEQVQEYIRQALVPLARRLDSLEKSPRPAAGERGAQGEPGREGAPASPEQIERAVELHLLRKPPAAGEAGAPGKDGAPGCDATMEMVLSSVTQYLKQHPPAAGAAGERGPAGPVGERGADAPAPTVEQLAGAVASHLQANPPARGEKGEAGAAGPAGDRGPEGAAGQNAVVEFEEIVRAMEEVHGRLADKYFLDLERRYFESIQRALERVKQPADGAPGKDGAPGRDGSNGVDALRLEDFTAAYDGERGLLLRFDNGKVQREFAMHLPIPIHRGFWRKGQSVQAADTVTEAGSLWIAKRANVDVRPSHQAKDDWTLAASKGVNGEQGPPGKDYVPPASVKLYPSQPSA